MFLRLPVQLSNGGAADSLKLQLTAKRNTWCSAYGFAFNAGHPLSAVLKPWPIRHPKQAEAPRFLTDNVGELPPYSVERLKEQLADVIR